MKALAVRAKKMCGQLGDTLNAEQLCERFKKKGENVSYDEGQTLAKIIEEHRSGLSRPKSVSPSPKPKVSRSFG